MPVAPGPHPPPNYQAAVGEVIKRVKEEQKRKEEAKKKIVVRNARWDPSKARVGDKVKLRADVINADDGTPAKLTIWERDKVGSDDHMKTLEAQVKGGRVEAEWEYEYRPDHDDIPSDKEKGKDYTLPEYGFEVEVKGEKGKSPVLEYRDGFEGTFKDEDGDPIPDVTLVFTLPDGKTKKVKTDAKGHYAVDGLPPGVVGISVEDAPFVLRTDQAHQLDKWEDQIPPAPFQTDGVAKAKGEG
ncbi:carboxypeptidase-like regulatory domain-containing protein [Planctomycetota bacterium]